MFKGFRYTENLRTLKKSGSLLYCNCCEKIIGSILIGSYKVISFDICCRCGTNGFLQYSPKITLDRKQSHSAPAYQNGIYSCPKCKTPLFSIAPDRVLNYTFYVECSCGEVYDTRVEHTGKLSETVGLIKQRIK